MGHHFTFACIAVLLAAAALPGGMRQGGPAIPAVFVPDAVGDGMHLEDAGIQVQFRPDSIIYRFSGDARALRVSYAGSRVQPHGARPLAAQFHYFQGAASAWRTGVTGYSEVVYGGIWPGIDLAFSLHEGELKSEYRLAPGAQASRVKWQIAGADSVSLQAGALVALAGKRSIREARPEVYEIDRRTGERRTVAGAFRLSGASAGIAVGAYDHRNRLVFDPVIGFSTYLGGSGQSQATAIAIDSNGNSVIAGYTTSLDLSPGAITLGPALRTTAFIARLTASGSQLISCTYLGGSLDNRAFGVAVDRWNNIYLAGTTSSANFPLVKALQPTRNGAQDAFIAELTPAGNALVFSTYWGGSGVDQANAITVDRQAEIYVTGDTQSTDYPVVNPFQPSSGGGFDAFVVKFAISGSKVLWSSYLGGGADEHAAALAVDFTSAIAVTGSTNSTNFPVVNAFQPNNAGSQNGFVARIGAGGRRLLFSTYLGGSGATEGLPEAGAGVAVDNAANIYVAGTTASTDFPVTVGAFQTASAGGFLDAFATKFNPWGAIIYSTYVGGVNADYGCAMAVDAAGNAHLAGYTASADFPSLRAAQPSLHGGYDLFVTKLNAAGTGLVYSTLLGGALTDSAAAIALDRYGTAVVAGQTFSTDFPTSSAYQTTLVGDESAIVARLPVGWSPVLFSAAGAWSIDVLRNGGSNGFAPDFATVTSFGNPGDVPILGDWSGTGHQFFGIFRNGTWFLDVNGNGIYDAGDRTFIYGQAGDVPVVGDWDGSGTLKAGLFRNGAFLLDFSGFLTGIPTGKPGITFPFGQAGDIPVTGDWNSLGTAKVGVFRNGLWLLDTNGSHTINGPEHSLGQAGDRPLVGDWDGSGLAKAGVYRSGVYRSGLFLLDYNGNWIFDAYGDVTLAFGASSPYGLTQY